MHETGDLTSPYVITGPNLAPVQTHGMESGNSLSMNEQRRESRLEERRGSAARGRRGALESRTSKTQGPRLVYSKEVKGVDTMTHTQGVGRSYWVDSEVTYGHGKGWGKRA